MLAGPIGPCTEVTLHRPPPLETTRSVVPWDDGSAELRAGERGNTAGGRPGDVDRGGPKLLQGEQP